MKREVALARALPAAATGTHAIGSLALVALGAIAIGAERSQIYIYDLAVAAPSTRGHRNRMILELKRIGALRGAYVVFVQADIGDGPAISLYTRLGTCEDVLHSDIPTLR